MTEDQVLSRLETVRSNLEKLERIPQSSFAEFIADFRNLDSALYRLQTSIQALIDLSSYLGALKGLGAPRTSVDALEKLETAQLLPPGSTQRFAPLIGFRNRIVHLYDRVDPEIVYRILTEHRADLGEFARLLAGSLARG